MLTLRAITHLCCVVVFVCILLAIKWPKFDYAAEFACGMWSGASIVKKGEPC
jgi:hypothetical protein